MGQTTHSRASRPVSASGPDLHARSHVLPQSAAGPDHLAQLADSLNCSSRVQAQKTLAESINQRTTTALLQAEQEPPTQRKPMKEKKSPAQTRSKPEEKKTLQGVFAGSSVTAQLEQAPASTTGSTGLPGALKAGIESLSGISMDKVRVHYNSDQPAQLNAMAYAQGADIHLETGQERHLPHEAWHVVQQTQGRVRPTMQMRAGVPVNDDKELEREADVMGAKALQARHLPDTPPAPGAGAEAATTLQQAADTREKSTHPANSSDLSPSVPSSHSTAQCKIGFEFEVGGIKTERQAGRAWVSHHKGDVITQEPGYNITADISENGSQLEFVTDQFDETDDGDLGVLRNVAKYIKLDMERIVAAANAHNDVALASDVEGINGTNRDRFLPELRNYLNLAGQLQMTGGVSVNALAGVVSGTSMPDRQGGAPGTRYQDYAVNYKDAAPDGALQQPIFRAALGAVDGFVGHADSKKGGLPGKVRGALAAVVTLMAQIPLNMRGDLPVAVQALFLARTDYAKILKMICDNSRIDIDRNGFAGALLSTINQFATTRLTLDDDVFPAGYRSAGQQLTGVSIGDWARGVVPAPGKMWGRWQGSDLVTKKNFPGTQAQKAELRAFGGFGDKTDPGNKLILEWRNLQVMYADQLELVMTGLADYLKKANE